MNWRTIFCSHQVCETRSVTHNRPRRNLNRGTVFCLVSSVTAAGVCECETRPFIGTSSLSSPGKIIISILDNKFTGKKAIIHNTIVHVMQLHDPLVLVVIRYLLYNSLINNM